MKKSNLIKRIFAILLSAVLLLSALPVMSFAEESYTLTFNEVGDEVTVTFCKGRAKEIVVPETYNGKPVTTIGDGAFAYLFNKGDEVEPYCHKVILPKTIKKIGFLAFGDSTLSEININELENLEYIGAYAFMGTYLSGDIVLPESVTYVGASAFTATKITSLHLGRNVNVPQAEQSSSAVECIFKRIVSFGNVFGTKMETTSSEKSIALACSDLTKVTVDSRNPYYRSVNGVLYSKDMTKLYTYPSGKTGSIYVMPVTVDAFYNALGGFYLNPVKVFGITVDLMDRSSSGFAGLGSKNDGDDMSDLRFASDLKTVVISDRVSEIVDIAFYNTGIESVFIPKSVTKIGQKAFWHCTDLTTVGFDRNSSFKTLPKECFKDCTSLKNVTFGRIEFLDSLVFNNCSALERVDLTNVLAIDSTAFDDCTNLTDIVYQNTDSDEKATVSKQAFYNHDSLETVMLGNSVEKIEAKAFANCKNLTAAYISDEIEDISDTAFDGCDNLTIYCPSEECYAYSYAVANNIAVTTLQVMPIPNQTYTGESIEPELTVKSSNQVLKNGNDYSVYFKDNIDAGLATATVMGEGKYSMFASVCKFAIVQRDINDGVEISEIPDQVLNGEAVEPEITLTFNGRILEENVDYIVEYMNNTEAGTATVAVMGKNNFVGVYTAEFEITEPEETTSGDANGDGIIDASDYAMIMSYVMGQGKLTEEQKEFADYNKDGVVDAFDAIAIDLIVNKIMAP
ncbi:MAG: leucine-rich repeat protein [Oscillospiraceae bacterium]|nr:leucine-rich repeat protein [Oscillospiraceae bacterium]